MTSRSLRKKRLFVAIAIGQSELTNQANVIRAHFYLSVLEGISALLFSLWAVHLGSLPRNKVRSIRYKYRSLV
jgi:hypothetical protein